MVKNCYKQWIMVLKNGKTVENEWKPLKTIKYAQNYHNGSSFMICRLLVLVLWFLLRKLCVCHEKVCIMAFFSAANSSALSLHAY